MSLYSFEGASGRHYDYALLNHKTRAAFPIGGGNYVFVQQSDSGLRVICAGETENIWNVFVSTTLWEKAKKEYGATAAYIHLNPDQRERHMETSDIVTKHQPPLNVQFQAANEA